MNRLFLVVALLSTVLRGYASQSPPTIGLDVLEIDCTAFPAPCEAFNVPDGGAAVLRALEDSTPGQYLVSHSQAAIPGVPLEHVTEIGDIRFELALTVSEPERGRNRVNVSYVITRGESDTLAGETTVGLSPGEGPVIVGGSSESTVANQSARERRLTLVLLRLKSGP